MTGLCSGTSSQCGEHGEDEISRHEYRLAAVRVRVRSRTVRIGANLHFYRESVRIDCETSSNSEQIVTNRSTLGTRVLHRPYRPCGDYEFPVKMAKS